MRLVGRIARVGPQVTTTNATSHHTWNPLPPAAITYPSSAASGTTAATAVPTTRHRDLAITSSCGSPASPCCTALPLGKIYNARDRSLD
jgi:hypothetical protein